MKNIEAVIDALRFVQISERNLLELIGEEEYAEHRPLAEYIESPNDNWVCFEGSDWFLEFVNDEFLYLAIPHDSELPASLFSKYIIRKPVTKDFRLDQFLLIGNKSLLEDPESLSNRYSPIISELLQ